MPTDFVTKCVCGNRVQTKMMALVRHNTRLNFPRNYILLISNDQFVRRDFSLSRGMRCKNSCCRDGCVASNCLSFCIAATGAFQCLANLINAVSNCSNSCVDMWYPSTIVADVWFTLRTVSRLGKKNDIQFFLASNAYIYRVMKKTWQ